VTPRASATRIANARVTVLQRATRAIRATRASRVGRAVATTDRPIDRSIDRSIDAALDATSRRDVATARPPVASRRVARA